MTEIKNLKDLAKRKKALRKEVQEYEKEVETELDIFRYGVKTATFLRKWGGTAYIYALFRKIGYWFGSQVRSVLLSFFKSLKKPSFLVFLIGGWLISFFYQSLSRSSKENTSTSDAQEE